MFITFCAKVVLTNTDVEIYGTWNVIPVTNFLKPVFYTLFLFFFSLFPVVFYGLITFFLFPFSFAFVRTLYPELCNKLRGCSY